MARTIVDMLEERLGVDILLLDVSEVTILADYFILCSATSERQLKALAGDLSRQLKAETGRPLSIEGEPQSGWILIDYGSVVVHLFLPEMRRFYALEDLWKRAQTIVRIQ
ncbi:MAG: ribosome silencing factor [Anaerolineae bacterium]|nr:ribosome silencing factor [Anaerolineae bacterium]